jgi:hypothetical protein
MANRYWLCFDVGLTSSFEDLFSWLDDHHAQECCENLATFLHDKGFEEVATELSQTVQKNNGRGTRFYLIGKVGKDKMRGRFIVGKRKASPWQGFGTETSSEEKDEG